MSLMLFHQFLIIKSTFLHFESEILVVALKWLHKEILLNFARYMKSFSQPNLEPPCKKVLDMTNYFLTQLIVQHVEIKEPRYNETSL